MRIGTEQKGLSTWRTNTTFQLVLYSFNMSIKQTFIIFGQGEFFLFRSSFVLQTYCNTRVVYRFCMFDYPHQSHETVSSKTTIMSIEFFEIPPLSKDRKIWLLFALNYKYKHIHCTHSHIVVSVTGCYFALRPLRRFVFLLLNLVTVNKNVGFVGKLNAETLSAQLPKMTMNVMSTADRTGQHSLFFSYH